MFTVIAKVFDSAAGCTEKKVVAESLTFTEAEQMVDRLDGEYPQGVYAIDEESGGRVYGRA